MLVIILNRSFCKKRILVKPKLHILVVVFLCLSNMGKANEVNQPGVPENPLALIITCPSDVTIECGANTLPANTGNVTVSDPCDPSPIIAFYDYTLTPPASGSEMRWIILPPGNITGSCSSGTNCQTGTICIGLEYTPNVTGTLSSYTTGFLLNCFNGNNPILSNASCGMVDHSDLIDDCSGSGLILINCSGNTGSVLIKKQVPVILHQVCLQLSSGGSILFDEDEVTDLTTSGALQNGVLFTETPAYTNFTVNYDDYCSDGCQYPLTIYRKFVVTDICNNVATCLQNITIKDLTPPAITCPANVTVAFGSNTMPVATGTASSNDSCDNSPTVSFTDVITPNACPPTYLISRKWKSTDDCGNTSTCIQTINVVENIPPVITCPPNVTIQCTDNTSPMSLGSASATDNCDAAPVISFSDVITVNSCPQNYTITRRWIAADQYLNRDTCFQTIVVKDNNFPVLTCPPNITIVYPASTNPSNTGTATASDLCDASPVVSYVDSISSPSCPLINLIKRTWHANDACGHQSSCVQWITIQDHGTICGAVHDDLGQAMGGVQIQLIADVNSNLVQDGGDTLVTTTTTNAVSGSYCFTNLRPCQYIVVEMQPGSYGNASDYDATPDPDGDDSADGPDNQIPVALSQVENDGDNNFVDIICPTQLPTLPFDTICSGQSVNLSINNLNLGALTYSWNFGSGSTPGTGSGLGPHMVSYITTTQNQSNGASVVLTISKTGCNNLSGQITLIDVNVKPNASINTSTSSICYYTNKVFQPVAPFLPGATYTWNFGTGAVPSVATGYGPHTVYYTSTGSKTAKLVIYPNEAGAQCPDSSTVDFTVLSCPGQIIGNVLSDLLVGIGNVTLKLFEDSNADGVADNTTALRTVTTLTTPPNIGLYVMASLTPGSYVIVETQPSGWISQNDFDVSNDGDLVTNVSGTDNLIPVTIIASEVDSMNNFIEAAQPGTITGSVFVDDNGDMIPNPGEGISGVTLKLFADVNTNGVADNNTPVATQTTDANGEYIFSSIAIGSYVLTETNPAGYLSIKDYDPTNDGDIVPNTDMNNDTIPVTMTNNESDANNYFLDALICPRVVTNTNDMGYGSLRYIIDCANPADTITFHSSLSGLTITLTSQHIDLTKNLVFISTLVPRVTISSSTTGLFSVLTNVSVEFKDLNLISGNVTGQEGSVFENMGQVKLHNVNLTKNPSFPAAVRLIRNQVSSTLFLSGTCQFNN